MIKSVIFVTGSLADGGAEKVMSILASGCAELGADVTLVVLRPKKIVYPVSDKVKIVQFTDEGKLATIKRIKKLHRVMKESAAEVVIPFLPIISLYTLIANIGLRKKVIMSENRKFLHEKMWPLVFGGLDGFSNPGCTVVLLRKNPEEEFDYSESLGYG